ncbi:Copine-8 [Orchesella cincta]|uniref:Copine-8 n=1 Tax=Orchesella cincta TaxID=48709 RepID=A0A1D2MZG9_ORCCI|nr:Copine-8 [Orchesella cincta]
MQSIQNQPTFCNRNLLDKDILSKSDPMCVVYHKPRGSDHWVELLRTETIKDTLNPDFTRKVTMEYRFEEQQPLRFELYDIDSASHNLADHDFLGFIECTLAHIVAAGSQGLSQPLNPNPYVTDAPSGKPDEAGTIILLAEELASLKDEVNICFSVHSHSESNAACRLPFHWVHFQVTIKFGGSEIGTTTCFVFRPSVMYTISKLNDAGKSIIVHRSEKVTGRNPTWLPTTISVRSLCNGDKDRTLKVDCYEIGMGSTQKCIGSCNTSLNQLVELGTGGIRLRHPDGRETNSTLLVLQCQIKPIYTFLDYIQNGTQIHCCFAIDFTSSNGDPSDPASLHFFSDSTIIQDYDAGKMFPVYGFGARIPPLGAVSHNFYVTLTQSSYCYGIPGVMESYRNCIRQIQMYGPTCFSPIINHVAQMAAQNQNGEHYYILLIITDGIITDMPNTKEAIVNASTLPLSIIILAELISQPWKSLTAMQFVFHIVQFVPYRDAYSWMKSTVGPGYGAGPVSPLAPPPAGQWAVPNDATHKLAQVKLAQEVLAEIPDQLTGYMKSRGIFPGKTHSASSKSRLVTNA